MKKILTGILTVICLFFITFIIYNEVLKVGLNLRQQSQYLEYAFYAMAAILFYIFVLDPIITVLLMPFYQVSKYCSVNTRYSLLRRRANRLKSEGFLEDAEIAALDEALAVQGAKRRERLAHRMSIIYSFRMKKNLDKMVNDTAKDVFCLTAVSQNGFFDMIMVLTNGLRLIKRMVVACGFRPTFIRMCKLYINVFASAMIADGAQKIDIMAMVGSSLNGILKTVSNSALNGAMNAFSILRIGMITKNYLYSNDPKHEKSILRDLAVADAASMLPGLVLSLVTSPLKGISGLFSTERSFDNDGEAQKMQDIIEEADFKWRKKKDKKKD